MNEYDGDVGDLLSSSCRFRSVGGPSLRSDAFYSVRGVQANLAAGGCGPDVDALTEGHARRIHELRKRGVLDDDDVDDLIRVIDEGEGIDSAEIRTALKRVEMLGDDHEIKDFMTAKEANDEFVAEKKADGWENPQRPHEAGSIVIEFETQEPMTLYRVYDSSPDGNSAIGEWVFRRDILREAEEPADVVNDMALPPDLDYDSVSRANVEPGETVQVSTAGEMKDWGLDGGKTQFRLITNVEDWDELDDDLSTITRQWGS